MRKLLPLRGQKSLKVLNAFHCLLIGLKMLPAYAQEDYHTFYDRFKEMDDGQKETMLREAIAFVPLDSDEVAAMVSFATDKNGAPYTQVNEKNLTPDELFEIILAVCMEVGAIKIDLISEAEKKRLQTSA